ncbi:CDP-alcohol phosphatidyltransferase family protein [Micromonospora sp. NBC_01392]
MITTDGQPTRSPVALDASHGWARDVPTSITNVPNAITVVRTVVSVFLAVTAISSGSGPLLAWAVGAYWLGDILDGWAARTLGQETRFGAVLDIACDRLCCALCLAGLMLRFPEMTAPLALFAAQFLVLDLVLSLSFLRWPVLSPNYFHLVHPGVYRWNWSPVAKAANTGGLVVLAVVAPSPVWPALFAVAVVLVKAASLVVVRRLPRP